MFVAGLLVQSCKTSQGRDHREGKEICLGGGREGEREGGRERERGGGRGVEGRGGSQGGYSLQVNTWVGHMLA